MEKLVGKIVKVPHKYYFFLLALAIFAGCRSANSPNAPVTPLQGTSLSITLSTDTISGSLLGATENTVLYQVSGPAMQTVSGVVGPFSSTGNSGSIPFTIPLSLGPSRLMSFQLNNAANGQPLAVGAIQMDFTSQPGGPIQVLMGSVARNCYSINTGLYNDGSYFTFETDALANAATVTGSTGYDVDFLPVTVASTVGFQMNPLNSDSVAYLGNGNLVQFAMAPSSGYLASSGAAKQAAGASVTLLQAGDVYCVAMAGGGHAWLQVVSAGSASAGPSIRFRVNTTLPYYAYEQTTIDKTGNCPGPLPTPTPTVTFTPTATSTPTATNSPTISPTPTVTNTPTATSTSTLSLTPTNSPTITLTPSVTNSPSVTLTFTVTNSPTGTFTPSTTFTPGGTGPITVSGTIYTSGDTGGNLWVFMVPASGGGSQVYEEVSVNGAPFTLVSTAGSYNLMAFYDYLNQYSDGGNIPSGLPYNYYQGTLPSNLTPVCTPPASPLIIGSASGLALTIVQGVCYANTQTPLISPLPTGTPSFTRTPTPTLSVTPTVTSTNTLGPGDIITVAGNGTSGFKGDGGKAVSAELSNPSGIAVDSSGNLYIADSLNNRIRKVDTNGNISTVAGNGTAGYLGDGGSATSAELFQPWGVAVDSSGNIYISDWQDNVIREVSGGSITTVAGYYTTPACASNWTAFQGDGGPATCAELQYSTGIAVDSSANIYIGDTNDRRIREVSAGIINTIAGGGLGIINGEAATLAGMSGPYGVAVDSSSNIYISDLSAYAIYEVSGGNIAQLAGNGLQGYSGDGGQATSAEMDSPRGIAVDSSGNIYFADNHNHVIRMISGGIISTYAGSSTIVGSTTSGVAGYTGDGGPATFATLNYPAGVAVDSAGNLYIADTSNNVIRKVIH